MNASDSFAIILVDLMSQFTNNLRDKLLRPSLLLLLQLDLNNSDLMQELLSMLCLIFKINNLTQRILKEHTFCQLGREFAF